MNSSIYVGLVRHRRFTPKEHLFKYPLYMLGIDLNEIEQVQSQLQSTKLGALSFRETDYLGAKPGKLKQAALDKFKDLGAEIKGVSKVTMLCQVRCFGIYFSPVNFYFLYQGEDATYMLAEVSNTPWNERHYYLVPLFEKVETQKDFHVSPFMPLNMKYKWQVIDPKSKAFVHIENWQKEKVFDATLVLKKHPLNSHQLFATLTSFPLMSLSIVRGIYWQALKLFLKSVPFYSHS